MAGSKPRRVFWTEPAPDDLDDILAFISLDRPLVSQGVGEKLLRQAQTLETHAHRGRVVPELEALGVTVFREIVVAPWRFVYHIEGQVVHVLYVMDSRRRVTDVILKRLLKSR